MTNTIANVPRELLERVLNAGWGSETVDALDDLRAILSTPSPAGVDGLDTDRNAAFKACPESGCDWGSFYLGWKARGEVEQAIIDGLRGENERIRLNIAEYNEAIACYQSERDQQAQRVGELEGLLRSCLPALSDGGCAALANRIDAALSAGK